jgi:AraC-like DNA-binding protein
MTLGPAALIFGPQSRIMPVSVTGSFISIGIALRAGAGNALYGADASKIVDRIVPIEAFGLDSETTLQGLKRYKCAEDWFRVVEERFRALVEEKGRPLPDPITVAFETLSYSNPNAKITDFAKDMGISLRKLERQVRRDFGLTPKQVMVRARALDMASHLRGVADEAEAEQIMLRYFDQAQMSREFTQLFGMSPRKFIATPNPLLTLTLESRQARRLEALERLEPGASRPWQ